MGIPWQGITHDLSKFSFTEFFESVKYYQGGKSSPINEAKKIQGYSSAWQHHKGRNPHHYEYLVDKLDEGGVPIDMPAKYKLEMLADYLAAGKTYMKDKFSYKAELEWWNDKKKSKPLMHSNTIRFINMALECLSTLSNYNLVNPYTVIRTFVDK